MHKALDQIRVKVIGINSLNTGDVNEITHRIQQLLGASVNVNVELAPSIPRTTAGKFKPLIAKV